MSGISIGSFSIIAGIVVNGNVNVHIWYIRTPKALLY
jgi:hypothetical protein